MKIFISCDLEGVSGVVSREFTTPDGKQYARARELMTSEVNAVVEGALEAGATEVVVNDSHGSMTNLLIEKIHPGATLITGAPKPLSMMQGIDSTFDAAIFVGYHARMGTHGVLSHTISGAVVANVWVNDILVGETGINAGLAGYFGVPVVLVTGDNVVADEAKSLLPWVHTAVVKHAVNRNSAQCLPPQKVKEILREATISALKDRSNARAWLPSSPVTFKLEFKDSGLQANAARMPFTREIDPRTLAFTANDYLTAFMGLRSMIGLAAG